MAKSKKEQKSIKPKSAGLMTEIAVEKVAFAMGRAADLDEVLRKAGLSRQRLAALLSDDEISQAMETRLDAVINAPWRFVEDHGEQTVFLREHYQLWRSEIVSGSWEACQFGYSVMEANYQFLENGLLGFDSLQVKPLEWFEPKNNGELLYRASASDSGVDVFSKWPLKFFLTRRKPTYKQPYGDALLSKLYWLWFFRTNTTKFWVKFLERFGSPLLVGKVGGVSKKQEDIDAMTTALLNAHAQSVIAIDSADSIDTVGANFSGAGSSAFQAFDNVLTRRIQKVILGQTLTSGTDGTGSRALGEVHEKVRLDKRNSDIRMIIPTIQEIINALCLLNGFEKHTIILGGEQDLNVDVVERDLKLKDLGVQFNQQYITDTYSIKPEHFQMVDVTPTTDNKVIPTFSALPQSAFSFKAQSQNLKPEQVELEQVATDQPKVLLNETDLEQIVTESKNSDELMTRLYSATKGASVQDFEITMAKALFMSDVMGYVHSQQRK